MEFDFLPIRLSPDAEGVTETPSGGGSGDNESPKDTETTKTVYKPQESPEPTDEPKRTSKGIDPELYNNLMVRAAKLQEQLDEVKKTEEQKVQEALDKAQEEWKQKLGEQSEAYQVLQKQLDEANSLIKTYREQEAQRVQKALDAERKSALVEALDGVEFVGNTPEQKAATRKLVETQISSRFTFRYNDDGQLVIKDTESDKYVQRIPSDLVRKQYGHLVVSKSKPGPSGDTRREAPDEDGLDDPQKKILARYAELTSGDHGWIGV